MAIQGILVLFSLFLLLPSEAVAASVGICYGRVANNLPPIFDVINILKSNNVSNVRIFDADPTTLQAFSGTGIKLMIGVPNEMLDAIAQGTPFFALQWLQTNILSHIFPSQVQYIAVGNEVFLKDPYYAPYVVPAIVNLYQALQHLNLHESIKLSSPQAASILSVSYPPSSGTFNPSLRYTSSMEHVSLDYALFRAEKTVQDGRLMYGNLFEASIDAFLYAIEKEGFGEMEVVVSETGWPKGGGVAASVENALAYNENVVRRAVGNVGTPKRPGEGLEVYLFDLFDENEKSGNECEKHFGIFGPDGTKAYDLRFN
ncbi:Glycoside hydrolase, family 17 [Corchorus olitorius]|uniref:glucan endo-1,3-beta-D-glucosidase n=1 Tax=Corchorus olitorius TaxID=93759 RepID=A0A1R3IC91_9ROSI|nr:Glycoside hydrolase, family 17 [Corchorus olitorius]